MSSTTRTRAGSSRPSDAGARATPTGPRPLPVAAAIGAAASLAVGLALCAATALLGWFLSDAGAHGSTTDALRVGADAWLLGVGATLHLGATSVGVAPLAVTALLVLVAFRTGRWAAADADGGGLALAVALTALIHLIAGVVLAVLAPPAGATASTPAAMLGSALLGAVGGGAGLAVGSGHLPRRWATTPGHLRTVAAGAVSAVAGVVCCAAVLVAASLALSFSQAATAFSALQLSAGDAVVLLLVTVLIAPNAVLLAVAWLAGPGFAVGTGTSVTAGAVTLGTLPTFPLLAALPGPGSQPGWCLALLAVPPLVAAWAAGAAQRRYAVTAWDSAGLRGFAVGVGAAVVLTALAAMAGGPLGSERLVDVGAPVGDLLVALVGGMGVGGLIGGLAVTAWQRRHGAD